MNKWQNKTNHNSHHYQASLRLQHSVITVASFLRNVNTAEKSNEWKMKEIRSGVWGGVGWEGGEMT